MFQETSHRLKLTATFTARIELNGFEKLHEIIKKCRKKITQQQGSKGPGSSW